MGKISQRAASGYECCEGHVEAIDKLLQKKTCLEREIDVKQQREINFENQISCCYIISQQRYRYDTLRRAPQGQ